MGDAEIALDEGREPPTVIDPAAKTDRQAEDDRVVMSLGVFGNQRFGSERAFELVRPVIAMTVRGRRSAFTFGTLPALPVAGPMGPDRGGPHALLPPLQRETLAFDRPYEAGLQWDFKGSRLTHSMWLEWQRLNTPEHRERFDGGLNGEFAVARHVSIPLQIHVVHEGGQLFDAGPVADSAAAAAGVNLHADSALLGRVALELFGAAAQSVPDRERPDENRTGIAFFGRASAERAGWRGHLIMWRGKRFIKDEGDPNYQSLRRNGRRYGGIRDYAEAGLARRFTLAPAAVLEISGRIHRTESFYEYSYRVLAIASPRWRLR